MGVLAYFVAALVLFHAGCIGQNLSPDLGQGLSQDLGQGLSEDLGQGLSDDLECHWDNDYDGVLDFKCRDDSYAITAVKSCHSNSHEDRRFHICCSKVRPASSNSVNCHRSCYWSSFVNNYDQLVHFSCKSNYYINGMYSKHCNKYEDRVWKYRCCQDSSVEMKDCVLTGWTNDWDKCQTYRAPAGYVLKGVVSIHQNSREDRRYEYMICKVGKPCEKPASLLEYLGTHIQDYQEQQ